MIDADEIARLQIDAVERWHRQPIDVSESGLMATVTSQHATNFRLWHQEDTARSPTASNDEIADGKRTIDGLNQTRNDLIERIDDTIAVMLDSAGVRPLDDAKWNTETPGSVIDRLSIMALRLYHYREQLERDDVDDQHVETVDKRIELCHQQHVDLTKSLQELLEDLFSGKKRHKIYRQFKMYNDKNLNPAIYTANSVSSGDKVSRDS